MENSLPALSVVVITFNQLDFLKQTIDSIAQQNTEFRFELIVSDDCSTDGTRAYCESYQSNDRFDFKYVCTTQNGGITANCNSGLKHINGRYVTLIGGDDLFLPSKIQKHVEYMDAHPEIALSYHPVDIFNSETDKTILLTNQSKVDTPLNVLEIIELCIPGSVSVVARVSHLPVGGFDERLPVVSDWLYYIEVAAKGKVGFIPHTLARYRKHGNQASSKTYELLDESLKNLDIAKQKLPMLDGIDNAIAIGKSRYILGEAYRQLINGHKTESRKLIMRAISIKKTVAAYGLLCASYSGISLFKGSMVRTFLKRIF
jgi:glycosyltransferase involved in cell wall biosynthesis